MANVKEYSIEEKLISLLQVQKADSKLDETKVLKGELPDEVRDLEDEILGLTARVTRIEEEINGISEFISGKQEAIKESEALLDKYKKQSENVKNNREFEALSKEMEMQGLEIQLANKHISDAQAEKEVKARQLESARKVLNDKDTNLKHKKADLEKIIAETEKDEAAFRALSEKAREKVEGTLLQSYQRIRDKNKNNGLAVVSIVRDACGGCFNAIPPQRQSEVRQRKKILVCENCGRILVDAELEAQVNA
jgi:predicted  nucleic acid-binding Zn-ribbon protein